MDALTKVTVHGPLAEALGKSDWAFLLERAVDVFQALEANTRKLVAYFQANPMLEYRVVVNGDPVKSDEGLSLVAKNSAIRSIDLVPVIAGAGNEGTWLALIGIIIVALVLAVPTGGYSTGYAAILAGNLGTGASFLLTLGLALTLGGVSQMIFGPANISEKNRPEQKPSYLFDGPVNLYGQGGPFPIGFGVLRVGSVVISAGIRSVDVVDDNNYPTTV